MNSQKLVDMILAIVEFDRDEVKESSAYVALFAALGRFIDGGTTSPSAPGQPASPSTGVVTPPATSIGF